MSARPGRTGLGLQALVGTGLPGPTGLGLDCRVLLGWDYCVWLGLTFSILVGRNSFSECGCLFALRCTPHLLSPPGYYPLLLQASLWWQVSQETTSWALLSGPSAKEIERTRLAACFV